MGIVGSTWAGTYDYRAARLLTPTTLEQAQELVATATKIRALGSRHSFHNLADTAGDLISLTNLPGEVTIDDGVASVPAWLTYGALAPRLEAAGWALPALASLPHISVAGAIATATHGSGVAVGNLASAVVGMRVIRADGELVHLTGADLAGAVHLGALGVVAGLDLAVQPTRPVRQVVVNDVPWSAVLEDFGGVASCGDSVSLFTRWLPDAVDQMWVKTRDDGEIPTFGGTFATVDQHPIRGLASEACTPQLGVPGPWYERLPHFRMGFTPSAGAEIQSEYLLPREHAAAALEAMLGIADVVRPVLQVTEIRTVAADEIWLSSSFGYDVVAIHLTLLREPEAVRSVLPVVERALEPFGVRPHWGKWFTMPGEQVAAAYPRIADFRALAERLDPTGKFRNAFLDANVWV